MIWGLQEANALARVSYHAQELSLLTAKQGVPAAELAEVKRALDEAFQEMFTQPKGKHGVN